MICLIWGYFVLVNKRLLEIVTSVTYLCTCNPLLIKMLVVCSLSRQFNTNLVSERTVFQHISNTEIKPKKL